MLLEKITNTLQGQVRLRAVCAFPERVLNLCGARELAFWNLKWESPTEFTCTMSRKDWYALRRAAKNLDATLSVEKKTGVPFFLGRFRTRRVLLAGIALCALALFFGSFFIWDFTVEGNKTVTDEEILRALESNGIQIGTFAFDVDGEDLRNHVLLEIPELSWIAVNVSGCQAQVQVRERVAKPELADRRTPSNLVARRTGLVLKVSTLMGQQCVLPGTTVEKGQLLISGVQDTDTFGARVVAGLGSVTARTWYTLKTEMPLLTERKVFTGKDSTRVSLIFGTHRVKFPGNSNTAAANYDKITKRTRLRLFGLPLPVTAETETYRFYERKTTEAEPEAAQKTAEAFLTDYLHTLVDAHGTVKSVLCSSRRSGDTLTVTLQAECVEEIGQSVPVYTDTNESDG